MKRTVSMILLAASVFLVMVSGCAESTDTTEPTAMTSGQTEVTTDTQAPATNESPGNDGDLIYASQTMGSDNFYISGGRPPAWSQLTNDRLIRFNYNDEAEGFYPELAERWEFSSDYSYMDVYLRQGVQWQGGYGELTADDVQYTFDTLHRDPKAFNSWWFGPVEERGFLKNVEVVDTYHVRFNFFATPYPAWITDLAFPFMGIASKKYIEEVGADKAILEPIGTGPWHLIEHVQGSYMKFERFDDYWGKKPEFKSLTIKNVPEVDSGIAMLKTGEADVVGIPPEKIAQLKADGLGVFSIPEAEGKYILFGGQLLSTDPNFDPTVPWASHTDEPADSEWNQRALKVRKALNLAINREAIRSKIMYDSASPMSTYMWPGSMPGYKTEWQDIPYDTAQAKQLLAEAGYPDGFAKPITMYVDAGSTFSGAAGKQTALTVADDLEAIGLKVNREVIDANAFNALWYTGHKDAWGMSAMRRGVYPEVTKMWPFTLHSTGSTHEAFMHPAFDKIYDAYRQAATMSTDQKLSIAQSGIDFIYDNYMFAPIAFTSQLSAFGPQIKEITRYEKYKEYSPPGLNFSYIVPAK